MPFAASVVLPIRRNCAQWRPMTSGSTITILAGTRKGLFIARSANDRRHWQIEGPHMPGFEIQRAFLDPRDPQRGYAAAHHAIWGIHIYRTEDAGHSWTALKEVPRHGHDDGPDSLQTIWSLAPGPRSAPDRLYAGIEPPGLFVSEDRGESWQELTAFREHPSSQYWRPAKGGCAVHSLAMAPQGDRFYAALAAGGVYRSDNAGDGWQPLNHGIRAPYLPGDAPIAGHNDHGLRMHPANPLRLYRQSHTGLWRSDDGGEHWTEITDGLPSDFGYALALDARKPDTVFCIPEESSQFRATVDGKLRVYRSEDAGECWQALTNGLPQSHCYVTVLRDGMDSDDLNPLGLYLGTSSGQIFASADRGEHWSLLPATLPPILSIQAQTVS